MNETIKLTQEDICRHLPHCECKEALYFTVPNYGTFVEASAWLRDERKYKFVSVYGVRDGEKWTGEFTFKFLCEQEYMWFKLRWA